MSDQGYPGWVDTHEMGSDFGALSFLGRQSLAGARHVTLVQVKGVHGGGIAAPPTVDVQPLVAMMDQQGTTQVHDTIYNQPTMRIQGGASAVVIDPVVGDIGIMVFADRDISSAMKNQGPSNPGSWRRFDWADGLYLGSVGYTTPTSFVEVASGNVTVTAATSVVVNGPSGITLNGPTTVNGTLAVSGAVTGNSTATFTGEVTGVGKHLSTHLHSGVQTGGGISGPPV